MKKKRILCMLQNAWGWPGYNHRLCFKMNPKNMTVGRCMKSFSDYDVWFTETTPVITADSRTCPPIDYEYVDRVMQIVPQFDGFVTVGNQAKKAISNYNIPIPTVSMRHPNARGWSYTKDGFPAAEELKKKIDKVR